MKKRAEAILWVISFLSLTLAAMTAARAFLLVIAVVWFSSTVVVVPLHFYNAWRRWGYVANRQQFAPWGWL